MQKVVYSISNESEKIMNLFEKELRAMFVNRDRADRTI